MTMMHCTWCGALDECAPAINGDWTCDACADRPPRIGHQGDGYGPQKPREHRADDDPPTYAVPAWTDADSEDDYQ